MPGSLLWRAEEEVGEEENRVNFFFQCDAYPSTREKDTNTPEMRRFRKPVLIHHCRAGQRRPSVGREDGGRGEKGQQST